MLGLRRGSLYFRPIRLIRNLCVDFLPLTNTQHTKSIPDAKAIVAFKLVNSLNPDRDIAIVVLSMLLPRIRLTSLAEEDNTNCLLPDYKNEDVLGELLDAGPTRNPKFASGKTSIFKY